MMQHEVTSNVTVGDDILIKEIYYNVDNAVQNRDGPMQFDNETVFDSDLPLKIYSYEWTVISSALVYAYQTYMQNDMKDDCHYDPDSSDYVKAEKQFQVVPGHLNTYVDGWKEDNNIFGADGYIAESFKTTPDWAVRTIKFQAKMNSEAKRKAGKGKWKIPPISLNANRPDTMQFRLYVRNTAGSQQADIYSLLRINSWKQEL